MTPPKSVPMANRRFQMFPSIASGINSRLGRKSISDECPKHRSDGTDDAIRVQ